MASLQERNGSFRVMFCFHGKLHTLTLGKVARGEAEAKLGQIEYLLMRLKQKLICLPDGTDIVPFVRYDGSPPKTTQPESAPIPRRAGTLVQLKERYLTTHGNGTVEASSLATSRIHLSHLCRLLGDGFPLPELTLATLQSYVDRRATSKISAVTIRKEITTFRAAWNWGVPMRITSGMFPTKGLRYPKTDEKMPFMTLAEIKARIAARDDSETLWESLYLTSAELAEMLEYIKSAAQHPWLYPLFCFAAHTGARRSELIRASVADVDFGRSTATIREKKKNRGKRTTRRVPLTPMLTEALREWLEVHPGGPALFCHAGVVARSKKRSSTTGHRGETTRSTSSKERAASVRSRERAGPAELTRNEVHDHFRRVLRGSKWEGMRGLHTLRHSFISACASKGIDQRLIDEWCGHQTDEQRKRYRHLYPSTQAEAIRSVFG